VFIALHRFIQACFSFATACVLSAGSVHAKGSSTVQEAGRCPLHFSKDKKSGLCVGRGDWQAFYKRSQNCPYDWRSSSNYCIFSATNKAEDDRADANIKSSNWTFARLPLLKKVPKSDELDMCPSGYFTHRADLKLCVTHYQDAPASRLAAG
jgi:hypothetical protein